MKNIWKQVVQFCEICLSCLAMDILYNFMVTQFKTLKCLLPISLDAVHILNKQQIQKYRNPKTVTYGQTVSVLSLVKNMYLGQQTHYAFFLFYGWLYMTRRSHGKLHSGRSRCSQYTAIAPLHREFTTHADKLISQRASDPHITQVLRRRATLWLECFVFLPCNCSVKQSVPQPSLADPGGSMVRCSGFWAHTNTAGQSWPSPWFLVDCEYSLIKLNPPSLAVVKLMNLRLLEQFVGCNVCSLLKAKQKSKVH